MIETLAFLFAGGAGAGFLKNKVAKASSPGSSVTTTPVANNVAVPKGSGGTGVDPAGGVSSSTKETIGTIDTGVKTALNSVVPFSGTALFAAQGLGQSLGFASKLDTNSLVTAANNYKAQVAAGNTQAAAHSKQVVENTINKASQPSSIFNISSWF